MNLTTNENQDGARGFTYVSSSVKKRRTLKGLPLVTFETSFAFAQKEIQESDYLIEFRDAVRQVAVARSFTPPKDFLCLGLGSPTSSRDSRLQLVIVMELLNVFGPLADGGIVYDPIFSPEDNHALASLGLRVVSSEEIDRFWERSSPSVLFMPHCDLELYEKVLRQNWSKDKLPYLILIGNDFRGYGESKSQKALSEEAPHMYRILPFIQVTPLPPAMTSNSAFVSLVIQTVSLNQPGQTTSQNNETSQGLRNKRKRPPRVESIVPRLYPSDEDFWRMA